MENRQDNDGGSGGGSDDCVDFEAVRQTIFLIEKLLLAPLACIWIYVGLETGVAPDPTKPYIFWEWGTYVIIPNGLSSPNAVLPQASEKACKGRA